MERILENLWQVAGEGITDPADAAAYLVRFGDTAALIDAGTGIARRQVQASISDCLSDAVPLAFLFLTHCHYDHTGGAAAVRDAFGCRIIVHEKEAGFLERGDSAVTAANWYGSVMEPLTVDIRISGDRQRFAVGNGTITAHHCPGHSPGSVVYGAEIDGKRVLFGQDVHGPLHPSLLSDRNDYLRSLRRLLELDAEILCEGHFGIYRGRNDVRRFIGSFLQEM